MEQLFFFSALTQCHGHGLHLRLVIKGWARFRLGLVFVDLFEAEDHPLFVQPS